GWGGTGGARSPASGRPGNPRDGGWAVQSLPLIGLGTASGASLSLPRLIATGEGLLTGMILSREHVQTPRHLRRRRRAVLQPRRQDPSPPVPSLEGSQRRRWLRE